MHGRWGTMTAFVLLSLVVGSPTQAGAQGSRDSLIASAVQAYDGFDSERALELLAVALNPRLGPRDGQWAGAIQLLAQILLEEGRDPLARVWLRWAIRLEPTLEIDTLNYLRAVAAFREAQQDVGPGSPEDSVTSWEWAAQGARDTTGAVRIESTLDTPIQVSVDGVPTLAPGQRRELAPGTYQFAADAQGHFSDEVTREVLPGVTTVLTFNLAPIPVVEPPVVDSVISDDVVSASLRAVAHLRVHRFATAPSCGTGFVAASGGVFITTYTAIRGADSVEIGLPDGRQVSDGITVAAYDVSDNYAVLRIPISGDDSLALGSGPDDGTWAWALGYRECEAPLATRVRIATWIDRPIGLLELRDSLTVDDGAPLLSREGAVIGLVTDARTAVPIDRAAPAATELNRPGRQEEPLTVAQVALRERHQFGAVELTSDVLGAIAQITPLESWHWSTTERVGPLPMTFAGPMGRYQIDLTSANAEPYQTEFVVSPSLLAPLTVAPPPVAAPPGQITVRTGGKFPWPLAALGVAAAGGAVALLAGGGGDGGGNGGGTNGGTSTGGIVIEIPNR